MNMPTRPELLTLRLEALGREDAQVAGLLECMRGAPGCLYQELAEAHGWELADALMAVINQQQAVIEATAEEVIG